MKSERLLKSNALERTRRNKDLASKRILQDKKNVNAMKINEISKSPEQIFGDLICQLLGQISNGEVKDLVKIELQQMLIKAKLAKSREMQNAPYINSFNVTPTYGLVPPSQPYPSSIQFPTFN